MIWAEIVLIFQAYSVEMDFRVISLNKDYGTVFCEEHCKSS